MTPAELESATHREFDRFRGKLAGFIEACGLPERQERALVSTMKQLSYEAEAGIKTVLLSLPDE